MIELIHKSTGVTVRVDKDHPAATSADFRKVEPEPKPKPATRRKRATDK